MRLADIIKVYSENDNLSVVNRDDDLICTYDGKNSIPKKYNDYDVIKIYPLSCYTTVVMIDADIDE